MPPTSSPWRARRWDSARCRARNGCTGPPGARARSTAARSPTPSMSSTGMIRMQCSGQMSTHPPHRMQREGVERDVEEALQAARGLRAGLLLGEPQFDLGRSHTALGRLGRHRYAGQGGVVHRGPLDFDDREELAAAAAPAEGPRSRRSGRGSMPRPGARLRSRRSGCAGRRPRRLPRRHRPRRSPACGRRSR